MTSKMTPQKQKKQQNSETVLQLAKRMSYRIVSLRNLEGFTDGDIYRVLNKVDAMLKELPAMLEIDVPAIIFGDIHGQLGDLIRYFQVVGYPPKNQFLFLGDYVDRGSHSLEVIMLLFAYKIQYPDKIHMTRGNHECFKMNRLYGFYEEVVRKRNSRMWRRFQNVFNNLSLCALVGKKIMGMHGGISQHARSWDAFHDLKKPKRPKTCDEGLALDLMWADPTQDKCSTFAVNSLRSISVIFGDVAVDEFLKRFDLELIVRAHEVSQEGFSFLFNRKVVTVFSAPFYCGNDSNCGAIMHVSKKFEISFTVLRPRMIASVENREMANAMEINYKNMLAPSPDPNRGRHIISSPSSLLSQPEPKPKTPTPSSKMASEPVQAVESTESLEVLPKATPTK